MSGITRKAPTSEQGGPERVLIVKGHYARLASQSEQFANELTRHLGICAPECRILRKVVCFHSSSQIMPCVVLSYGGLRALRACLQTYSLLL